MTDDTMPGMTGTELASRLMSIDPDVQILVVSGYGDFEEVPIDGARLTSPSAPKSWQASWRR